jgi:flagellar biogenesis protein FliO
VAGPVALVGTAWLSVVVALLFVVAMIAAAAWVVRWVGWVFFIRRYDGSQYDPCDTSA